MCIKTSKYLQNKCKGGRCIIKQFHFAPLFLFSHLCRQVFCSTHLNNMAVVLQTYEWLTCVGLYVYMCPCWQYISGGQGSSSALESPRSSHKFLNTHTYYIILCASMCLLVLVWLLMYTWGYVCVCVLLNECMCTYVKMYVIIYVIIISCTLYVDCGSNECILINRKWVHEQWLWCLPQCFLHATDK